MRRAIAAAVLALFCANAAQAESVSGEVRNLVFEVRNLDFNVENLGAQIEGLQITETETETRIEMPADILFDFDKTEIRATAQPALKQVAGLLRKNAHGTVTIEGHTDAKGTAAYNQKLSEARSASVQQWLVEHEGLGDVRFIVKGVGASHPVAPNTKPDGSDDPEGRQKNRRVEIVIGKT